MRIIILIIVFFSVLGNSYSQVTGEREVLGEPEIIVPIENQVDFYDSPIEDLLYYKDVNNLLDKFVGVWEVNDGVNYLKISIAKHEHLAMGNKWFKNNDFEDKLILTIVSFKLNGVVKYTNEAGIGGNFVTTENLNAVELHYSEPSLTSCSRKKSGNLTLEVIQNGSTVQLTWTRVNMVYEKINTCADGTLKDDSDFLIPENLVLNKL
ncbi:DUF6705 family protein [Neptunitalea lumnitzerae]|uniref:DUF6705 domain-containing protein n=1 Tax=Neptunitalea lumnitzerae TaxID=2965509 RepID=A0ABQ5MHN6_9FLAO|nr:hypothetical protein [Neptunitalea sp. Y10]GLB48895.1 hypothetical protein Y10_12630 [Neptunitalea sp. Y10]